MSDKCSAHYPLDYAFAVVEGMRSGKFLYVAHPDIFLEHRFDIPEEQRAEYEKNAAQTTEMICQAVVDYDIPLEINMGAMTATKAGMRKVHLNKEHEYEYEYPVLDFWRAAESKGCKVIVGIDAHWPEAIVDRTDEVVFKKRLERNGIHLRFIDSDELWMNNRTQSTSGTKKNMSDGQGEDGR